MDITEFLHSVWQERFPNYLPDDIALSAYENIKTEEVEIYNNALFDFLDTWIVNNVELLQQAINFTSLENFLIKKELISFKI